MRFYQWAEPTLSLGYFQPYADRAGHEASRQSAVVRRTSGGGAILHDFDVTYSLAVPDRHPLAADRLRTYRVVHTALIEVLAAMGIEASLFAPGCPGRCFELGEPRSSGSGQAALPMFSAPGIGRCGGEGGKGRGQCPTAAPRGGPAARQRALGPLGGRPRARWTERIDREDDSWSKNL